MISDWLAFWDSRHFLYVNTRHKDVRYPLVAQAIAALVPSGEARVLDYGSGEALHADLVGRRRTPAVRSVSDVIRPETWAATDAWALLRFGKANGFFFAALWGLLRSLLSDYWRLRSRIGLTRYAEATMIEKLGAAGFAAERAPANIGHNQARRTCYARPR